MFRALRLVFLAVVAVTLIGLALANRDIVTLRALPPEAGDFLGFTWSIDVPLFAVVFAGILLGLLVGFVWEWMREYKLRKTASTASRKVNDLERELRRLKAKSEGPKDDVLALMDNRSV
jgi:uncharacterized integral membrane protein